MAKPLVCLWMGSSSEARRLARALEREEGARVVIARSEDDAMRHARKATVLIAEFVEADRAVEVVRSLGNTNSDLGILVVARDGVDSLQLLEAGAMGILTRRASFDDMLGAARALARGEVLLDPALAARVLRRMHDLTRLCEEQGIHPSRCASLSPREQEVITHMARGLTNEVIAASIGVSTGTVKTHVHKILHKLGVENRRLAGAYWRLFQQTRPKRPTL